MVPHGSVAVNAGLVTDHGRIAKICPMARSIHGDGSGFGIGNPHDADTGGKVILHLAQHGRESVVLAAHLDDQLS